MTPHIEAKKGEIAKTVLMPGDPLRAKYIAENYLSDVKLVNDVRNIYAYTGKYKDKDVTIMASGMGMPSIGIYSYELYKFYDVEHIIRIGSVGAYTEKLNLYDVVLVSDCYSESSFAETQNGESENILSANDDINKVIIDTAKNIGKQITVGTIHSSDVFYKEKDNFRELYEKYGLYEFDSQMKNKIIECAKKYMWDERRKQMNQYYDLVIERFKQRIK